VRVTGFRKVYPSVFRQPVVAVDRASFGLEYGECFALLGVNGAGKTTTFRALTHDDPLQTGGTICIEGLDLRRRFGEARKYLGYCPQHDDALIDLLSVEEHLHYYARIRGVPGPLRAQMVEKSLKEMNLVPHRFKTAQTLSGGNKRKLSVALALLGNPRIILLDEPSAGMDPKARRFLWTVVSKMSQHNKKSAVVLTTHSMEEAEALSTKMGIMIRGGIFKCFGSSQHLKNKFGTGYEVEVRIKAISHEEMLSLAYFYSPGNNLLTSNVEDDVRQVKIDDLVALMKDRLVEDILLEAIQELDGDNLISKEIVQEAQRS